MAIKPVNLKGNQPWILIERTDAEASILWPHDANSQSWKRPWCWERLKAEGEGDGRGWGSWLASSIQWTWTRVNCGRWWGTGKAGVLYSPWGHKESDTTWQLNNATWNAEPWSGWCKFSSWSRGEERKTRVAGLLEFLMPKPSPLPWASHWGGGGRGQRERCLKPLW